MYITCDFHYDSAHFLPYVDEGHKCRRMHGHTYRLTVTLKGEVDSSKGWVMDFAEVKTVVEPVLRLVDHRLLNDVTGLLNPTAEVQAQWWWNQLRALPVSEIRLREGMSNEVIYRGRVE
jgi:6-pyruvoyltetrahydropterin/6-carboxytetrahydropterin synthase